MHLKILSAKWQPFCLYLNVLINFFSQCMDPHEVFLAISVGFFYNIPEVAIPHQTRGGWCFDTPS